MKEMDKLVDIEDKFPYKDILYLEHPEPKNHRRQPIETRAGMFAPFAALVGYGEQVKETERYTSSEIYLDDEEKVLLDEKLNYILFHLNDVEVEIIYFLKDKKKSGGKYITKIGKIKKIDNYKNEIVFDDNERIKIKNITKIEIIN